jgi:hypothetical protein
MDAHAPVLLCSLPAEAEHVTPRIIPMHPAACVPLEASHILWHH